MGVCMRAHSHHMHTIPAAVRAQVPREAPKRSMCWNLGRRPEGPLGVARILGVDSDYKEDLS
eukprot:79475-Pelagomonas_calceolata.AAC.1